MSAGYRADGLRAWKTNSSGTTYYIYDGDKLVEEVNSSGATISDMTWGPGGLLARTTSTRTLLYTTYAIGQMAQQVAASSGSVVASYLFDAWGARQVSTSDPTAGSDPFSGYNTVAGYYTDWETGLQLLGHRYYDPTAGRFLTRDPIGLTGGMNLYAYCGNCAVVTRDSSGFAGLIDSIPWPEDVDPGEATGKGCLGQTFRGIVGVISWLIGLGSGGEAACRIILSCIAGILGVIAAGLLVGWLPVLEPLFPCIASAIGSLLNTLAGKICDCRHPPINWGCAIASALLGCVSSMAGGYFGWGLGGLIIGGLVNTAARSLCDNWIAPTW